MQLEEKSAHVAGSAGAESLHADYAEMDEAVSIHPVTYDTGLYWGDERSKGLLLRTWHFSMFSEEKLYTLSAESGSPKVRRWIFVVPSRILI